MSPAKNAKSAAEDARARSPRLRVVAYVRVSTTEQVDHGQGLDIQRKTIRAWARTNNARVVAWFSDEGVSGSNGIEGRDGLAEALEALRNRQADGLVVPKLDRLARSLTVQEGTLAKVWDLGCSVYATDLGEVPKDDPSDPMRTALRQMVGVFAELERGMIAARMRAGIRNKAADGGYVGGQPAYGYAADPKTHELVEHPDEQATLNIMRSLRKRGLSYRAIADELDTRRLPPRKGDRWQAMTVKRILDRA